LIEGGLLQPTAQSYVAMLTAAVDPRTERARVTR
jgi:hypothetical protein